MNSDNKDTSRKNNSDSEKSTVNAESRGKKDATVSRSIESAKTALDNVRKKLNDYGRTDVAETTLKLYDEKAKKNEDKKRILETATRGLERQKFKKQEKSKTKLRTTSTIRASKNVDSNPKNRITSISINPNERTSAKSKTTLHKETTKKDESLKDSVEFDKLHAKDLAEIPEDFIPYENIDPKSLDKAPLPPSIADILYPEMEIFDSEESPLLDLDELIRDSEKLENDEKAEKSSQNDEKTEKDDNREEIYQSLLNPDIETVAIVGDDKEGVDADENPQTEEGWKAYAQMWLSQQNPIIRTSKRDNKVRKAPSVGQEKTPKNIEKIEEVDASELENAQEPLNSDSMEDAFDDMPDQPMIDDSFSMPDDFIQPPDFKTIEELTKEKVDDDIALFDQPKEEVLTQLHESEHFGAYVPETENPTTQNKPDQLSELNSGQKNSTENNDNRTPQSKSVSDSQSLPKPTSKRQKVRRVSNSPAPMPAVDGKSIKKSNRHVSPAKLPSMSTRKPTKKKSSKGDSNTKIFGIAPPPSED